MLHLAIQRGLRCIELSRLEVGDLSLTKLEIAIQRKGRREKEVIRIPTQCKNAINDWLQARSEMPALTTSAMFVTFGNGHIGNPLTSDRVYRILRSLGARHGVRRRPHGLRHTAITEVLARTNNLEAARIFAGHRSVATTQAYLDKTSEWEALGIAALTEII
jgi:integrase/recombinase XerC